MRRQLALSTRLQPQRILKTACLNSRFPFASIHTSATVERNSSAKQLCIRQIKFKYSVPRDRPEESIRRQPV